MSILEQGNPFFAMLWWGGVLNPQSCTLREPAIMRVRPIFLDFCLVWCFSESLRYTMYIFLSKYGAKEIANEKYTKILLIYYY